MATLSRQSNLELLRIVSMLMVLTVHADGAALGLPTVAGNLHGASAYDFGRLAVESVAIVGVNCFTMISGYFGIRLRWRTVGAYLFECVFYAVLIYSLSAILVPGYFTWKGWLESWLVLSHTDLWYVPAYFGLMLLAPILNTGLEALSKRKFAVVLGAFIVFNVWCGWWWHGAFNPTGYTLFQLVMVYMIGRFLRLHVSSGWLRARRNFIAVIYLVSTTCVFAMSLYMKPLMAFAYNSPWVLASTTSLFMLFASVGIQSRTINYIARSAFAVYLIHKAPFVWGTYMKPWIAGFHAALAPGLFILATAGVVAGTYVLAMVIDPVRRFLSSLLFNRLGR